jgi:hypothetical protein
MGTTTEFPRLDSRQGQRFFSFLKRPDRLWCPSSLLCNGYRGLYPAGAWASSSAEVRGVELHHHFHHDFMVRCLLFYFLSFWQLSYVTRVVSLVICVELFTINDGIDTHNFDANFECCTINLERWNYMEESTRRGNLPKRIYKAFGILSYRGFTLSC